MADNVGAGTKLHTTPASGDVAWLLAASRGQPEEVQRLVNDLGPVVYGFVYARVGGDGAAAADLLQETFLEAIRGASSYRGESSLSTWICGIARNRIARHYEAERRREVARQGLVLIHGQGEAPDLSEDYLAVEQRDEVVRALGAVSPLHRQVLVLKYLDGRSVGQISSDIGKTPVQVQSLLQRARDAFRAALGGSFDAG
ncbi:MAG: RNA polymerase sigma factor [Actinomycetota bacterium]